MGSRAARPGRWVCETRRRARDSRTSSQSERGGALARTAVARRPARHLRGARAIAGGRTTLSAAVHLCAAARGGVVATHHLALSVLAVELGICTGLDAVADQRAVVVGGALHSQRNAILRAGAHDFAAVSGRAVEVDIHARSSRPAARDVTRVAAAAVALGRAWSDGRRRWLSAGRKAPRRIEGASEVAAKLAGGETLRRARVAVEEVAVAILPRIDHAVVAQLGWLSVTCGVPTAVVAGSARVSGARWVGCGARGRVLPRSLIAARGRVVGARPATELAKATEILRRAVALCGGRG